MSSRRGIAPELLTAAARLRGRRVGVIANRRGMFKDPAGGPPKFGGIVYADSAEKVAYFMDMCDRQQMPLLFVQDVSGFMVGVEAEHSGIIRAGARMVESMATARFRRSYFTTNHARGAGYYAMAGQGFDPDFIFTWPTGRMGVMEGESAVRAIFGPKIDRAAEAGQALDPDTVGAIEHTRAEYEKQLDATYAGGARIRRCDHCARGDARRSRPRDAVLAREPGAAHRNVYPEGRRVSRSAGARRFRRDTMSVTHCARGLRPGILGRLAGSPEPPGPDGPDRLSDARLPGRDHDVDPAEAARAGPRGRATRATSCR